MSKNAPIIAMFFSISVFSFLGGIVTAHYGIFPYPNIVNAYRTAKVLIKTTGTAETKYFGEFIKSSELPYDKAPSKRWTILDPQEPRFPVIVYGGLNQYLEHCPDQGCLAVVFNSEGRVSKAWPYRPTHIYSTDITNDAYPHEFLTFDPSIHLHPVGIQRYPNDDLLVNLQARGGVVFPFGMGVARIKQDGMPRWTRFDYSHHWSTLNPDGSAYVPTLKIDSERSCIKTHKVGRCETSHPQLDGIQVIDGAGSLVEEIDLVPILLRSNWSGLLTKSTDLCDPLHLNYIDKIIENNDSDLQAGDLVLSLRNVSSFIVLDAAKRKIKRAVSGNFIHQHSVHHLHDSKFLIFDNHGGDLEGPASRIVEMDLTTGVERRIFPNSDTPPAYAPVFTSTFGHLDISPDRKRVLASFTHTGRAFEVDIRSGRLLAIYDNLHDISSVPGVSEEKRTHAARFSIYGMSYVR